MAKRNGTGPRGEGGGSEQAPEIEVRVSPGELLATLARLEL
jgi:hypothetical protein